jgi:DNA-binding transcriptional ArsR family regulator
MPQSSVSEALRELRRAGFLAERKEGRWVYFSIVPTSRAAPLLRGLLAEAGALIQVQQDRARARSVQEQAVQVVCSKVQKGTVAEQEAAHA